MSLRHTLSMMTLLLAVACAQAPIAPRADAGGIAALAPGGTLRAGVYVGSPTSYIPGEAGAAPRGVSYDLAQRLAKEVGVEFKPRVFPSNEKLLEAAKAGEIDVVFTNATAVRAQFLDFTPTVMEIEKSYLVAAASPIRDAAALDRPGTRIGVSRGSTTSTELAHVLKAAEFVPMESLAAGRTALGDGRLDAYASNKAILFQMSDGLPGSRVLDGRWGLEAFAFGVPKGRAAAMPVLREFVARARAQGAVQQAAQRAGVRGLAP
jgi:polar amino acid transport system substrate-binding protein